MGKEVKKRKEGKRKKNKKETCFKGITHKQKLGVSNIEIIPLSNIQR